ncbi:MAG TPA: trimethylamine methyltransferase family protein [Thermoleophilia bacterium]|nr:trimethylamine methyltransferase family protein [Thermoleophilia bacterium]HQG02764.1 trimethylamine methyltransferase family protein [Thermoleophilia bacterium]HQG54161.1 trimethylamine methyltransferase family protein [Thermoleophilia bacterium]HQJ97063.1 trimethylamine methyltransferase family protein [Thermoleophilia bacterium]
MRARRAAVDWGGGNVNDARLVIWEDDACKRVHEATCEVLAETGVEVRYAPALEIFAGAGAQVDGTRVRIPAELVEAAIENAPRGWVLKPRGGETAPLVLDAQHTYCGTGSDVLYICDPDTRERRRVRKADVEGQAALCEKLPNIDFVMSMGLPEDVPQAVDDLAQVDAMLRGTRKPLLVAPRDGHILGHMKEMCAVAGAADSFGIYAMPVPPLMLDEDGASKVIACAELDVPLIWAPAPAAGTTAPASIAATIVVANAETLAGLVLNQAVKAGAPFVWGVGVGAMNMKTMNEVYASAGPIQGYQAQADLARWYDLPSFSYAGHSDSKTLDQQWAAEAAITTITAMLSRATLLHDVGYLEAGLQSSYESILFGDELVGYAKAFMSELSVDDEALALDEIKAVGPGGSHLGRPYTRKHYREIWQSDLFDTMRHDHWVEQGSATLLDRLRARVAALRAEPRAFELDASVTGELDRILAEVEAHRPGS